MNDALTTPTPRALASSDPATDRLGRLFDHCHARLYRLALRLGDTDETAHDLIQETFLRAAGRPAKVPDEADQAEAWLVRVMVNLGRDRWRRLEVRRRNAEHLTEVEGTMPRPALDPESAAVARTTVRRALAELPPRRRAVVALCELEGLSTAEAAQLLSIGRVTVRWHLAAARKQLAATLLAPASKGRASRQEESP